MTLPQQRVQIARARTCAEEAPAGTVLPAVARARLAALELLSDVAVRIASSVELDATLDAIAAAVVETLGFDVAVLNLVDEDVVRVAVVAGPAEVRTALLGTSEPLPVWQQLLSRSARLRGLCFIDGRANETLHGVLAWVPDIPVTDDPGEWHPHDALFATLVGSTGELLGVLSVDLPRDGRRPDEVRAELLERFAVMAALAIERARMHDRIVHSAELFRRTFEDAPLGMAVLTLDGCVEQINATYAHMVGRDGCSLVGVGCWELVHEADCAGVRAGIDSVASGRVPIVSGEIRTVDGDTWGAATVSRIDGRDGPRLLVQMLDVTEQRRAVATLRQQAMSDPLTGLRNRAALTAHLEQLLRHQRAERVAVLFCDVDRFKLINDTFGHAVGDALLQRIANAVNEELRGGDAAARLGGDEFVVVLDACDGPAGAIAAAERLRAAVTRSVCVGSASVTPSLSIGIALSDAEATAEQLLADADNALYRAKDAGRGRWELFEPQMRDATVERLRLREELRHAVRAQQLRLHYQPLVELASGRTIGYEALLRWEHPDRGLLLPGAFLGELLSGGLAAEATDWVIERALADAATWPSAHGVLPVVSVNISPGQVARDDLVATVCSALTRNHVQPDRLWIEVTEEGVIDGAAQLAVLAALREAGVHLALDDFGSGYAGLLALREVPADIVKLDRAFTLNIATDPTSRAIVEAVVRLCTTLGRTLVAEGLETQEHVDALRGLGVTYGQGWHLGRPQALPSSAEALPPAAQEPQRVATTDLPGELRRLDAALALAHDEVEVGRVALQAARRITGIHGGSLVLRSGDELRTVHAEGSAAGGVPGSRTFALRADLPLCAAVRDGTPVWLPPAERHDVVRPDACTQLALAALPLENGGEVFGGLGVSWTTPIAIDDVVRAHLVATTARVARRLRALSGPQQAPAGGARPRPALAQSQRRARVAAERKKPLR